MYLHAWSGVRLTFHSEELHREYYRRRDDPLLSPAERKWFDIVFDKFSSTDSAMKYGTYQSVSDLG